MVFKAVREAIAGSAWYAMSGLLRAAVRKRLHDGSRRRTRQTDRIDQIIEMLTAAPP
jgi:hypothetical protein